MNKELRRLIKNRAVVNNRIIPKLDYGTMKFLLEIAEMAIKHREEQLSQFLEDNWWDSPEKKSLIEMINRREDV